MKICTSRPSEEEMLEPPQGFRLSLKGGEEGGGVWGVGSNVVCEVDIISLSHLEGALWVRCVPAWILPDVSPRMRCG